MFLRPATRRHAARFSFPHRLASPALACAALLAAAGPVHASNTVPDWVRTAAAQPISNLPPSTKAVILLNEETYTVGSDGRATVHVRNVVKILRPQGRRYADPMVTYDNNSKITSFHVWSIDPAGHEYALKENEIADIGQLGEGGQLFDNIRAKVASPPGRDVGGIVAYEYEQRQRPYLAEEDWFFQSDIPHLNESLTLKLPPGYHFHAGWAHHERVEPVEAGDNSLHWQIQHVPAVDLDEVQLAPSANSLAGRMTLHYSGPGMAVQQDGSWKGIGEWFDQLAHDRLVPTPEIAAKSAELTAGKTDFYDKTEAIGEFVQKNIRYFVVEMGIGGFQPHPAKDIFQGRYGDCKDKATLLAAMLSSVGIHSTLVAVDTHRGVVDPDLPSIIGNHMIAAIEIPAGYTSPKLRSVVTAQNGKRYLIFDPTWELTPFGQLESNLQGSYGLLIEGEQSQIVELPVLSPDLNRVERSGSFSLSQDGTLKGTVAEKRFGDLAETNRYISKLDELHQQKFLDDSMQSDFVAVSLSGLKIENADRLNQDFSMQFNVEANHFATTMGPLLMIRPRVLGSELMPTDRKTRRVQVDLGETMQAHDSFDIQLPDGYTVDELPDPIKADFGFATYESATVLQGHTLHYSRTFRMKQVTLPANRYPELQKLAGLIHTDEQNRAVLKKVN